MPLPIGNVAVAGTGPYTCSTAGIGGLAKEDPFCKWKGGVFVSFILVLG